VGEEFKLVVRATGTGEPRFVAVSPDGSRHDPLRVAEHFGSNFKRPGGEWGTLFRFDRAGCWQIKIQRADMSGVITLAART